MRGARQRIFSNLIAAHAKSLHTNIHCHQRRCPVDHRGVHNLSLATALSFQQRTYHAERKQHATTTEITNQIQWRNGPLAAAADGMQGAAQRNIIDVVTRRLSQRPLLAPAGHTPINQFRVTRQAVLRANAKSLGHPWPIAFKQRIGALNQ